MRVRFRPEARAEIREARRWYESQVRGLGRAILGELDATVEVLAIFPQVHRAVTEEGQVRRALLHRFPYSVVYEIFGDEIVVLACRHVRQDEIDWTITRRDG